MYSIKSKISLKRKLVGLFVFQSILIGSSLTAFANVSLKNGNFFIGYTDFFYDGGMKLKVERTYNNKSSYNGKFGFGFGSEYEVYIRQSADGSVVIHENGGGAHNRFSPAKIDPKEIDNAVAAIVSAKQKVGTGLSAAQMDAEKTKLRNDARYRNDEWERLVDIGAVKASPLADGTVLKSNKFSYQTVTKVKDGFIRKFDSGEIHNFNVQGRVTRMADKNGNFVSLTYDKAGNIATIQDNFNRKLSYTFNRLGKVEKITGDNGKSCNYRYNGDELVYSKDAEGNVYEYRYSTNGRHNLVEVKYSDKTTMQIGYNEVNKNETVKWVKDRDGSLTEYAYTGEGPGTSEYSTAVTTKGVDGKVVTKAKYEYVEKTKLDGERYTYKLVTDIDGDRTETIYNDCCSMPLEITRNGQKTTFEYDTKGHVTKKMTPTEITELAYDPNIGKVSKVVKHPKAGGTSKWANFQYDDKGNLVFAKNSDGKGVKIVYDHQGRIKALIDQDKRQLQFVYNEANRPVEIIDPSVGKIQVQYTNSGEIKKVDSSGGRKIALQVTSAFQNLLEIIRPAGVSLSF